MQMDETLLSLVESIEFRAVETFVQSAASLRAGISRLEPEYTMRDEVIG